MQQCIFSNKDTLLFVYKRNNSHKLHIQKRIRISLFIEIRSFIGLKAEMFIKSYRLRILLVDCNFKDPIILNAILQQSGSNSFSTF